MNTQESEAREAEVREYRGAEGQLAAGTRETEVPEGEDEGAGGTQGLGHVLGIHHL